jgi:hypothetical protein
MSSYERSNHVRAQVELTAEFPGEDRIGNSVSTAVAARES